MVLAAVVIVWLVFRACHSPGSAAAPPQSLAADAATLASAPGKWQSEVLKITTREGTVYEQILGIEFGPIAHAGQSNAPDAQAKLFTASPTRGIPHIAEASTSIGNGSFRDVRLRESNGVRIITITRAVDPEDSHPAKTQRIYDRYWSVSFNYELKNNVLTLKGFPTTNKVNWGVSEFMVPQEEIKFKIVP
jgi:hypothetical protein